MESVSKRARAEQECIGSWNTTEWEVWSKGDVRKEREKWGGKRLRDKVASLLGSDRGQRVRGTVGKQLQRRQDSRGNRRRGKRSRGQEKSREIWPKIERGGSKGCVESGLSVIPHYNHTVFFSQKLHLHDKASHWFALWFGHDFGYQTWLEWILALQTAMKLACFHPVTPRLFHCCNPLSRFHAIDWNIKM